MIHFDHQAGTPLLPVAQEAMLPFLADAPNPSSLHRGGIRAREALTTARGQMAALLGVAPEEIVFTSGGTESANLALLGYARANQERGRHLLIGATEHAAVLRCAEKLATEGFTFSLVPVDTTGRIDLEALPKLVRPDTILLAVHWVNHEIGTIEPMTEISAWCQEKKIALFSDAGAAVGWTPLDLQAAPVYLLSFSPARFGGPRGVGVLYKARGIQIEPLLFGGNQEEGLRAGTENIAAIVGAGVAAAEVAATLPARLARIGMLQQQLWNGLKERLPALALNGPPLGPERCVQNLNVSPIGLEGEAQVLLCDLQGLAIASGAACVSRDLRVSHVMKAIGLDTNRALSSVLFTLDAETTEEEVDRAAEIYERVVTKLRASMPDGLVA